MLSPRAIRALPYKRQSLESLHESGAIQLKPHGVRVLLRAILEEDAWTGLESVAYDARQAVAHEVVALGGSVGKWYENNGVIEEDRVKVGDHVFVLSTAADRASKTDKACRLWLCHIEDLSAFWRFGDFDHPVSDVSG